MIDILIIGTEPPCPRCDLLYKLIEQEAKNRLNIHLRHCSFDSSEANELGKKLGYKIGTAKEIAKAARINIDWNSVYELIDLQKSRIDAERPADTWTPELDRMLKPCQNAAKSLGYLMTPILVINGNVKHDGSVPSVQQLKEWLSM